MILITGATGHIGNVLVKSLVDRKEKIRLLIPKGEGVQSLHKVNGEIFTCDIRDKESVNEAVKGCDIVYHLAGLIQIESVNKSKVFSVNVNGTKNVIAACIKNKAKMVYVSSVHAFPEIQTINEQIDIEISDKIRGTYGKSKAMATIEMKKAMKNGLDGVIFYPTGIIGPEDYNLSEMGRLIHYITKNISKRKLFYIDGGYDFVDVRDVITALISVIDKNIWGEEFILSGSSVKVKDIYTTIANLTNKKPKLIKAPTNFVKIIAALSPFYSKFYKKAPLLNKYSVGVLNCNSTFDNIKAKNFLDFNPRSFYETIKDTLSWLYLNMPLNK